MKVTICKTAGLCAGAWKAYNEVIKSLSKNAKTAIFKEILHNESLIQSLKDNGALFVKDLSEIGNDYNLILRAHGEEKEVYDYLADKNISYIDSICVNVKNVRDVAIQKQNQYLILKIQFVILLQ